MFCIQRDGLIYALYIIGGILTAGALANIHAWLKALGSLFVSQSRHLKKTLKNNEGAPLTALGTEVSLMTDMVKVNQFFPRGAIKFQFRSSNEIFLCFLFLNSAWMHLRSNKVVWWEYVMHWIPVILSEL